MCSGKRVADKRSSDSRLMVISGWILDGRIKPKHTLSMCHTFLILIVPSGGL